MIVQGEGINVNAANLDILVRLEAGRSCTRCGKMKKARAYMRYIVVTPPKPKATDGQRAVRGPQRTEIVCRECYQK